MCCGNSARKIGIKMVQRGFILLLIMSYAVHGMEKTTNSTNALPYLSLKEYTEIVGWQKAESTNTIYRHHQQQFALFRGPVEKFLSYETEPERCAFFATQNVQTRRAIINLSATLTDISGSYWPYARVLRLVLPEDILVSIGLDVCSDGAICHEKCFDMNGIKMSPVSKARTLLCPLPRQDMLVHKNTDVSNMSYRGLCSKLTDSEIAARTAKLDSDGPTDRRYLYYILDSELTGTISRHGSSARTQSFNELLARTELIKKLLYPRVIRLSNGAGITIQRIDDTSNLYGFTAFDVDVTKIIFDTEVNKTLFHRDDITNIAQVGPNCVSYCRKEKISDHQSADPSHVHVVYHLDLTAKPIETKIHSSKKRAWVGSLPYGHFVVMVEKNNCTSGCGDMMERKPGGCGCIVYNKHGIAIQKIEMAKWLHIHCEADNDGWRITSKNVYKSVSFGDIKDIHKIWVQPVIYTYDKKNKPNAIEAFDFLLQESMKLGTTASSGSFNTLLKTEKKESNNCIVS